MKKSNAETYNAKLRQAIAEIQAQIDEFEKQRQCKLEQQQRYQIEYCDVAKQLEENQQKLLSATDENRCLQAKNTKLQDDVLATRKAAKDAQRDLTNAVKEIE
jgi:septation ring formation regulator EzrA